MHEIELTPPQSQFYLNPWKYPLFVGGYGAGKSLTMTCCIFRDMQYEGANVGAYCPTYDLLSLITAPYLMGFMEEADIPYKYNKSRNIMQLEGAGQIILRSMDNPSRIVGYQTFRAHADEIDTMNEKKANDAWNKIVARNRQSIYVRDDDGHYVYDRDRKRKTELNRVSAYTTPEGFGFAYNRWVYKKSEGYGLIRAPTRSNPHLPADYMDGLRATYPDELLEAYLNAEFVNLKGSAVYKRFNRVDSACTTEIDGNEPLIIGMDFNVLHGAAVVYVKRGNELHAVDEIVETFDTDETVEEIKSRYPNNPINVYPDATGDKRTSSNVSESDIAKLFAAKFRVHFNSTNPLVKNRVAAVCAMLCNGNKERKLKVNIKKCPVLTDAFEQQIYNKAGAPDKSSGHDHVLDAAGYPIAFLHPVYKPVIGTKTNYGGY